MIIVHQEPAGGAPRTARSSLQNNEACLVGGVVGLAQFWGTGALAGAVASPFAPGPSTPAAAGAGTSISAASPAHQAGRAEKHAEATPGPATALIQAGSNAGPAQPLGHDANSGLLNDVATGANPPDSFAASPGTVVVAAAPTGPAQSAASAPPAEQSTGIPASGATTAPPQEAASPTQELAASFMQASLAQLNFAMTDHDSTAFSTATTYIEAIYDSIVFLGDNIAVANALNYAPLAQVNLLGGNSGAAGAVAQLTNLAFTDNDATAVAVAGTWINHAYNSIIVTGNSIAMADSANYAPATQINAALFSDADGSFGSLHEANFLNGDNDSTALAHAGLILGRAMEATSGSAPLDAIPPVSVDSPTDYLGWSEPDLV